MKRIMVTAYAVNPYKGSEDGTGWNLVCQIARYQKTIVITRENNQESIERYLKEALPTEAQNLEFHYFDLPYYMRFWKKGGRGALLYFYLWQLWLPSFIKKKKIEFDIAHHLNFHNNWTPTFLWLLGKPLVWGPIGHHRKIPFAFLKNYGISAWLLDRGTWMAKKLFWKLDPFLRLSYTKSDAILAVNSSEKIVHSDFRHKMVVMPAVASSQPGDPLLVSSPIEGFRVLSVGRFVPLKGFDVTISAFAQFYFAQTPEIRAHLQLVLVGKGPEKKRLQKMAKEIGIDHAIDWMDWVDKEDMQRIYQQADVFLFPSHEGAGMVIPEALSFGLPVLCFENYGPGELTDDTCAFRIPYGAYESTVTLFSRALSHLYSMPDLKRKMSLAATKKWATELCWNMKGDLLRKVYDTLLSERNIEKVFSSINMELEPRALVETDF